MLKFVLDYDFVVILKLEFQLYFLFLCGVWVNRMFFIEGYDFNVLEVVQLEDGFIVYIYYFVVVSLDSIILVVQIEVGLEDLVVEDDEGFSIDIVVVLEQYVSKVSLQSLTLFINFFDFVKIVIFLEDKVSFFFGYGFCFFI